MTDVFVKDKRVTQPVMLRRYFAVAHPSRPNYVALVSASTEGICGDKEPKPPLDRRHLGDLLEAAGQSWAVYAQSLPGKCNPVDNAGGLPRLPRYSRRHLGFFDFAVGRGVSTFVPAPRPTSAAKQST